jgi:hypothetical protein
VKKGGGSGREILESFVRVFDLPALPFFVALLIFAAPAGAQEFKKPVLVERERYVFGLQVQPLPGSRFSKLNLVPGGWELWLVAVNGAHIEQVSDADLRKPATIQKARASTEIHKALTAKSESGGPVVTVVVRRPGNARGVLVEIAFSGWDAGFEYSFTKWSRDPNLIIFPGASTQVGNEPYYAKTVYTEAERLEEIADYELRKREDAEAKKNPEAPLKFRGTYKIAQRRLRIDAGLDQPGKGDQAYSDARKTRSSVLAQRALDLLAKKEWFECHRTARAAQALQAWAGKEALEQLRNTLLALTPEERAKMRSKVLAQALAEVRDRNLIEAAEGAAFCLFFGGEDKEAARILAQTRKGAFGAAEMSKADLDGWLGVLGTPADLPEAAGLKDGEIYRVVGKVARAGAFTLVESGKVGAIKWVFEDKAGLKFDVGDSFLLFAIFESRKPPASMPEDLKEFPLLRIVVVR